MSRMLSKPGEKAHFAKIMVIRWVSVKILSRDAVPSADFTIVYCKKKKAGRPKAALLFWFFGGFRCGVPLFIVMLIIY